MPAAEAVETFAGSWELPEQRRSRLSADEKTVGLKGDGGREPGAGSGC
jgi:hypothetical protein